MQIKLLVVVTPLAISVLGVRVSSMLDQVRVIIAFARVRVNKPREKIRIQPVTEFPATYPLSLTSVHIISRLKLTSTHVSPFTLRFHRGVKGGLIKGEAHRL